MDDDAVGLACKVQRRAGMAGLAAHTLPALLAQASRSLARVFRRRQRRVLRVLQQVREMRFPCEARLLVGFLELFVQFLDREVELMNLPHPAR